MRMAHHDNAPKPGTCSLWPLAAPDVLFLQRRRASFHLRSRPWPAVALQGLLGVILLCGAGPSVYGDEEFPYTAYVKPRRQATVYSGPGVDFYATDQLDAGSEVEVHKHLNAEWAAIRPPNGSFSLVPVSALHVPGTNDLGTVVEEVRTIVGSRLGQGRHDVEYITLPPGEVVQILGSTEVSLEDGQDLMCYEIAPPAGEFRWIRRRDLGKDPESNILARLAADRHHSEPRLQNEHELVNFNEDAIPLSKLNSPQSDASQPAADKLAKRLGIRLTQAMTETGDEESSENNTGEQRLPLLEAPGWDSAGKVQERSARQATESADQMPSESGTPMAEDSLGLLAPPVRRAEPSSAAANPVPQIPSPDGTRTDFGPPDQDLLPQTRSFARNPQPLELGPIGKLRLSQELIDIELQLTKQVCESPATWHLSDLRTRAQAVIDTSSDPKQRATARNIVAKIAQFEDVRRRQRTIVSSSFDRNAPERQLVSQEPASDGSAYDGTGFLMPVVTQDPNIPKYVLTDEQGNIIQFVSPKPGISLKRYEQQRVGILGDKSYLPTYNQPHLMAERVITLDKIR